MDRSMVERHLRLAEEHVAHGARLVERQRELLAGLERDGLDTAEAKRLLAMFEQQQASHVTDRDRLRQQLAALP